VFVFVSYVIEVLSLLQFKEKRPRW